MTKYEFIDRHRWAGWVYGVTYRNVSRLLHRLNLHYAPPGAMAELVSDPNGRIVGYKTQHWCKWCGLRGSVIKFYRKI